MFKRGSSIIPGVIVAGFVLLYTPLRALADAGASQGCAASPYAAGETVRGNTLKTANALRLPTPQRQFFLSLNQEHLAECVILITTGSGNLHQQSTIGK